MNLLKTTLLPIEKAAQIQATHAEFNCELREIGIVSSISVKVTIFGDESDVKLLLASVEE